MTETRRPIRSEAQLDDSQRALLAWHGVVDPEEGMDRLRDHVILLALSLRTALRLQEAARELLTQWSNMYGHSEEQLVPETKRWLAAAAGDYPSP